MKKIYFFILPLIALFFPFYVQAEAVPEISAATYELVNGGIESLNTNGIAQYGVSPYSAGSVTETIGHFLGNLSLGLQPSDYIVRPLTEVEKDDIESGFTTYFYDSSGNEISINDLYLVTGSNNYYKTFFYIDSSGNVLYSDPYQNNTLLNVGLNDFRFGVVTGQSPWTWNEVYQNLANQIANNAYNYYPSQEDFIDNTYFVQYGTTNAQGGARDAFYVYIPNQFILGKIVPLNTNGYIKSWYTNDPSWIIGVQIFGSGWNPLRVQQGNFSLNGYNYSYLVSLSDSPENMITGVSYNQFLNGNNQGYKGYVFETNSFAYTGDLVSYSSGVYRKNQMLEVPQISPNEMYDYDELAVTVPNTEPYLDPTFDPDLGISPSNYPISYPYPFQQVVPGDNVLPGVNPGIDPLPNPFGDVVTFDPEDLPDNIPFIQNLERRFPFSIPWDIKRLLNGLRANAVTPRFEVSWYIQPLDYTWEFALDLSDFNDVAMLFRTCFLISFIIGLAIFSYNHFFGS